MVKPREELHRRRVRETSSRCHLTHLIAIKEKAWQPSCMPGLLRPLAERHDCEPGREHQTFLRTSNGSVDAPLIHPEINRSYRTDSVDKEQCVTPRSVYCLSDSGQIAPYTGSGLVVGREYRLDLFASVRPENIFYSIGVSRTAPVTINDVHDQPKVLTQLDPLV